jgi:DNA-binding HxlR family transcriptional regulator
MTFLGEDDFCPHFHHAIELIGRRWTGVVLRTMLHGATRFSDIAAAVPNLSDKMLAERLKELEAEGMITRTVVPETPVRIEYGLTEKGRALNVVVEALGDWADRWIGPCPETSSAASEPAPAGAIHSSARLQRPAAFRQRRR